MNEEYKIKGWVAREDDGWLFLGKEKPRRQYHAWLGAEEYFELDTNLFPELTWEDEPIEVELLIRKL